MYIQHKVLFHLKGAKKRTLKCQIFLFYSFFLAEYRDAFSLFDKRGDGKIDSDQIGDVLRALNLNPTEAEVKKIIAEVDPNGE